MGGKKLGFCLSILFWFCQSYLTKKSFHFWLKISQNNWMWCQLMLSKFTRPLLTHQSQEAIIIPSLYRMNAFSPQETSKLSAEAGLCSCQERNVAPLTSKGMSEAHGGQADPQQACPTHTSHCLHFIRDHTQSSGLGSRKQKRQQWYRATHILHLPR